LGGKRDGILTLTDPATIDQLLRHRNLLDLAGVVEAYSGSYCAGTAATLYW
jgi:hypothetical protein